MHKAVHPRDDIDTLYVSRKEGGRGITSNIESIDASIQWLKDYRKNAEEDLLRPSETILTAWGPTERQ